jgi:hypothetical protein
VTDTLQALGGVALIVGLFVAYALERRARHRPATPPPEPVVAPVATAPTPAAPAETTGGRRSINWGAPIIYCVLLWGGAHRDTNWRYVWLTLYAAMLVVAGHTMFSAKEFAIERRRQPDLTWREHWVKIGVPYLLFPVAGLALVLAGVSGGVIVPSLPWVFIILAAVVILPVQVVAHQVRKLWRKT